MTKKGKPKMRERYVTYPDDSIQYIEDFIEPYTGCQKSLLTSLSLIYSNSYCSIELVYRYLKSKCDQL